MARGNDLGRSPAHRSRSISANELRSKAFDLEKATAELTNQKELLERELKALE